MDQKGIWYCNIFQVYKLNSKITRGPFLEKRWISHFSPGKGTVTLVPEYREIAKQSLNVDSVGQFQRLKWLIESTLRTKLTNGVAFRAKLINISLHSWAILQFIFGE